jgi:hypothetical protein
VYIRRLRQKIEFDPSHPLNLITCRGDGYMLVASNCHEKAFQLPNLMRQVETCWPNERLKLSRRDSISSFIQVGPSRSFGRFR